MWEMKDVSRSYLLTRAPSWVGQFSGSVEAAVLLSRSDSKDLRDFAYLPTTFNRAFEPRICSNLRSRYLKRHLLT